MKPQKNDLHNRFTENFPKLKHEKIWFQLIFFIYHRMFFKNQLTF